MGLSSEQLLVVERLRIKLLDPGTSLAAKHRVLFALRGLSAPESQKALEAAMRDPSVLLQHEAAYCLGQQQREDAATALTAVLRDQEQHPMVRHEAAEALGAIGTPECLNLVREYCRDDCLEVAQTCQLAAQRIDFLESQASSSAGSNAQYTTVDPAPPAAPSVPFDELQNLLLDEHAPIFERYRALFALRNQGGSSAVEALGSALGGQSALLKHEVAYVLGQMTDAAAVRYLRMALMDTAENAMVRHEAAEALGSIADPACLELLQRYRHDEDRIVADSCEVALDMLAFQQSGEFEYVDRGVA